MLLLKAYLRACCHEWVTRRAPCPCQKRTENDRVTLLNVPLGSLGRVLSKQAAERGSLWSARADRPGAALLPACRRQRDPPCRHRAAPGGHGHRLLRTALPASAHLLPRSDGQHEGEPERPVAARGSGGSLQLRLPRGGHRDGLLVHHRCLPPGDGRQRHGRAQLALGALADLSAWVGRRGAAGGGPGPCRADAVLSAVRSRPTRALPPPTGDARRLTPATGQRGTSRADFLLSLSSSALTFNSDQLNKR